MLRRLMCGCAVAALLLASSASADDKLLPSGALTTTSPTAVSVTIAGRSTSHIDYYVGVRCDGAAYVETGSGSATATTASPILVLASMPPYVIKLYELEDTVSVLAVSGTVHCWISRHRF